MERAVAALPEEWKAIDILVNNAGLSRGLDKLYEGKRQDWEEMIDTNVKGLLYVTRAVVPGMVARGRGHIVNLGSTAGRMTYPNGAVYCATKAAERSITEGLREDLLGTPLRVTTIDPGMVETEFSEVRFRGDKATRRQSLREHHAAHARRCSRRHPLCGHAPRARQCLGGPAHARRAGKLAALSPHTAVRERDRANLH